MSSVHRPLHQTSRWMKCSARPQCLGQPSPVGQWKCSTRTRFDLLHHAVRTARHGKKRPAPGHSDLTMTPTSAWPTRSSRNQKSSHHQLAAGVPRAGNPLTASVFTSNSFSAPQQKLSTALFSQRAEHLAIASRKSAASTASSRTSSTGASRPPPQGHCTPPILAPPSASAQENEDKNIQVDISFPDRNSHSWRSRPAHQAFSISSKKPSMPRPDGASCISPAAS
jgi:hypothetical protein